ncbi:O-antigen ligase family protein [Acidipila rosea]|uniref:O-antigen ligase-like membrane protein n=1 Tax=Acidipila rosea TaxID=768535 RepID=A0A4R1L4S5_9BACT|nr:O-antigen ligase family protein [Acidipila rosea]TCK72050.1 O-antigen ligase-like membrane protein [Acidipila rosea]
MLTAARIDNMPQMAIQPVRPYRAQTLGAVAVMICVPALCIAAGQAGLLRLIFPVLALAVSAFLFWRSKPLYVGLVFWLWFLTPFLRRMADFQSGWQAQSAVLLAPYLAAGVSFITLLTSLRHLGKRQSLPYTCALVAVLYGFLVGVSRFPLFDVFRALLNWLVPIAFGYFLYHHRELYQEFRSAIEKAFLYGMLVTGAYGVYQFFTLPGWDKMWMLNVQMNSFGTPEAMEVRVFSTMNAPMIFAAVVAAGLLLLFCAKGKLRLLAAGCGFLALMLTMVRSGWLDLIAGFAFLAMRLDMRQRLRLALAAVACAVFLLASLQIPVIHSEVTTRIHSFSNANEDVSYSARIEGHESALRVLAQEPFGEGIGSTDAKHNTEGDDDIIGPDDSTVLKFLYELGWIGSLIYGVGLVTLTVQLARADHSDPFVMASKAIVIGLAAQCLLNSVVTGLLGFLVWTFAALSLAGAESIAGAVEQPDPLEFAAV